MNSTSTVLLTGATGFLGSHLLRGLLAHGFNVVVLKRSQSNTARIGNRMASVQVHDVDRVPLRVAFERAPIDAVIHAATCYGRKGEKADEIIATNVVFAMRLLETAAEFKVPTFLNTGTFSAKAPEPPKGLTYYVMSKRHFSEYGARFAADAGIVFVDLQLEHVYGPADDETKFVPSLIRALLDGRAAFDLTGGEQRRDFVYVSDVVAAYLKVLERRVDLPGPSLRVEVGSGEAVVLADFVRLARDLAASDTDLRFGALPYRNGEAMHSVADLRLLRQLGWAPAVALRDGLARTVLAAQRLSSQADERKSP